MLAAMKACLPKADAEEKTSKTVIQKIFDELPLP
jgi:hypothetical protein